MVLAQSGGFPVTLSDPNWVAVLISVVAAVVSAGSVIFSIWWKWFTRPQAMFVITGYVDSPAESLRRLAPKAPDCDPDFCLHIQNMGDGDAYAVGFREFTDFFLVPFIPNEKDERGISPINRPLVHPGDDLAVAVWIEGPIMRFPFVLMLEWTEAPFRRQKNLMQGLYLSKFDYPAFSPVLRRRSFRRTSDRKEGTLVYPFPRPRWYKTAQRKQWERDPFEYAEEQLGMPRLTFDLEAMRRDVEADTLQPQTFQTSEPKQHRVQKQRQGKTRRQQKRKPR